jgi:hypothetical protein
MLGVHLVEWQRTAEHGLGILKNHSEILPLSNSWTQPRGLWTIINPEGQGRRRLRNSRQDV